MKPILLLFWVKISYHLKDPLMAVIRHRRRLQFGLSRWGYSYSLENFLSATTTNHQPLWHKPRFVAPNFNEKSEKKFKSREKVMSRYSDIHRSDFAFPIFTFEQTEKLNRPLRQPAVVVNRWECWRHPPLAYCHP